MPAAGPEEPERRPPGRIVITGAAGQLGRCLAGRARRRGRDVLALTRSQCDITDPDAGRAVVASGDTVVNCAALTAVDAAESDAAAAHAINAVGAGNIARACRRAGARLIHLSTDYVFSGEFAGAPRPYDIDDPADPLGAYGRTKLAGERAVHAELPDAQVVRTAWVYSGTGRDFVATMVRLAAEPGTVDVVADQVGSPTYVADLAESLLSLSAARIDAPLLHAANAGAVSRFELARAVFSRVGADPDRVRPVSSDRHPRPAPRPPYSALSGRGSAAAGLAPLRPWHEALAAALPSTP